MKTCFKCQIEKPLSGFYKHKQMADGHLNKCKSCCKTDTKINYQRNIEHYKAYERKRYAVPKRVRSRQKYAKSKAGKKAASRAKLNYITKNPIKRLAHIIVGNAVRSGELIKSNICEICGSEPKTIHGHHDDYAKPLNVRWLCAGCHTKWHRENGEGLNGG